MVHTASVTEAIEGTSPMAGEKSYGQILKSSTIIGGSSVVNVLTRMVQVKVNALFLGPAGVGLFGLYGSIIEIAATLSNMGISSSGVRQIAEAVGIGDRIRIARTAKTLRLVALVLGCSGALGLFLLREPVCAITFGNTNHATEIGVLALVILFGAVSGGQAALIQGMRRIGDLARISIIGGVLGTILSVGIIIFFRERGIAGSLVAAAAITLLTSWWYARKIRVERVTVGRKEIGEDVRRLITLGLVLTASGLMTAGATYLIRLLIVRQFGLEAVGLYQSSAALSLVYASFILQAMGTDFYPRLTSAVNDHTTCNRLVNEQAEIGLLLAVPGILATLTFAPLVIQVFYSPRFYPAVDILRWQILGILLRVASWPMGFILLAKELKKLFFWTEFAASGMHLGLVWLCMQAWGLTGAGVAFFGVYVAFWWIMFHIARRVTGFAWSPANVRLGLVFLPAVAVVFASVFLLPRTVAMIAGGVVTVAVGLYNLKMLHSAAGPEGIEFITKKFGRMFR